MQIAHFTMDIESILNKIKRKQIILESEFQRGEVWAMSKKKKLIDTILRRWPIPPVIFLKRDDGKYEILDGLQRITTIYQFITANKIRIDGKIMPEDENIIIMDRMQFKDILNVSEQDETYESIINNIYNTPITVYEIGNTNAEEIAELFNRFNSPLALNTVEKRNAYFGKTRTQIDDLLRVFIKNGASKETLGFSNNRGTYEDVLLKVCYTIQYKMINKKITSEMLLDIYRKEKVFDEEVISNICDAIHDFFEANRCKNNKYSRATIYSILIHIYVTNPSMDRLSDILDFVSQNHDKYAETQLKSIYDEYTMYASTDVKSICVRQYVLKYLSNSVYTVHEIIAKTESLEHSQVVQRALDDNFLEYEI